MKIKNITLINILNTLNSFADKKLPQKINYAITKNIVAATNEYKIYETQFQKILEKFDKDIIKDNDGNIVCNKQGIPEIREKAKEQYFEEINELLNIETDLSIYYIDESVFDYNDSDKYDVLSSNEILVLSSILVEKQ